jgi:hypothetical protein
VRGQTGQGPGERREGVSFGFGREVCEWSGVRGEEGSELLCDFYFCYDLSL